MAQTNSAGPEAKDFENGYHLDSSHDPDNALQKIRTTGSLSISPELFEKIYLSPQNKIAGDLRKTFGNPTPFALCGFLLSLTPLSCMLMGWRGSGTGSGSSDIGVYVGFGGVMMLLGGIGEFLLGNTFPQVVFGSFGAFWIAYAMLLMPTTGAIANYSTTSNPAEGLKEPAFNASIAFFFLFMGVLCFLYTICALRTNVFFFGILLFLVPTFGCLAGAFWQTAEGNATTAKTLLLAAGACSFVTDMLGWYIFFAIMLASLDFPLQLPVGDLSHVVKGASEKKKKRDEEA